VTLDEFHQSTLTIGNGFVSHDQPKITKGEAMVLKRVSVFMLLVCLALASPCMAQQRDTKVNAEVKALVEQHNKALGAQDLKGVMDTYSSDPSIVLMGTGPGESYAGEEAIGGAYNQLFTRFDANTLTFKYDWGSVGSKGNTAWFAVTTTIEGVVKNEKKERVFNMSGTLEKVKGKWHIVGLHFSRLGAEQEK
jgi:ketosteroid isomerase-like protein